MHWHVLHTKPKHEKKVESELISLGIETYCPKRVEYRLWTDRKKKIINPVLPSMVLVRIEEKNLNKVFLCKSVLKYMFWLGKRAIVRDNEVGVLKQNLTKKNILNPHVGRKIGIKSFGDKVGKIERISKNKIWISLENFGYKLLLETA